jgi:hypothetical protein
MNNVVVVVLWVKEVTELVTSIALKETTLQVVEGKVVGDE